MVLLPAFYLGRPVELLEENHPRQRVRQGNGSEREAFVCPPEHPRGEPERSAQYESHAAAARETQRRELARKFLGREAPSPLAAQGKYVGTRGETFEEALLLRREHILGATAVHVLFRDLDNLYGKVAAKTVQVVLATFGRPAFQSPYRDDGGVTDHSISKSCSGLLCCS